MAALWESILISGCVAALIVVFASRAIERFGGLVGGVISTLPTTIVVAGFGFALTLSDTDDFRRSLFVVPLGQLLDAGVLCIWRFLPQHLDHEQHLGRSLATLLVANLGFWAVGAVLVFFLNTDGLDNDVWRMLAVGITALCLHFVIGLLVCLRGIAAPKGSNPVSWATLVLRALSAGVSIAITVYLSSLSAVAAGILATFPVIFMTSMTSLWLSQGGGVPSGASGPMILGSTSVALYALLFAGLRPRMNLWLAGLVSWAICFLFVSVPCVLFLQHLARRRAASKDAQGSDEAAPNDASLQIAEPAALAHGPTSQSTLV